MLHRFLLIFATLVLFNACSESTIDADLIIHNADIYTATDVSTATALAIAGDKILDLGDYETLRKYQTDNTKIVDANGHFLMPGFIEGHGHFSNFGKSLQNLNFLKDTSWQDIVKKVETKVKTVKKGEWIYGRGWHQEKWTIEPEAHHTGYPTHDQLSQVSPNNPVLLVHASGHSVFANDMAMKVAGVSKETADPVGGKIIKKNSQPIGVFEENALLLVSEKFNADRAQMPQHIQDSLWYGAIDKAQASCLSHGVTSFQDAGSKFDELEKYEQLAEEGKMDIRLWAMMRHSSKEMKGKAGAYRKIGVGDGYYTCRAIKTEVDGALGSHGAWLIEPYADKPGFVGQNTTSIEEVVAIAQIADENDMQLCVHAIGDRANKEVLDIMESYRDTVNEKRWRVEHAQHLNPGDIMRFKSTGALASMQGVHCTSDAPFVVKRLGQLRAKIGAYAWKALLNQGVTIINGTDTPVEEIDPIKNFHASVTRTRTDNGYTFFVENKMSREEALKSYTINAAYGAFEEDIKGSLEPGKYADIILLSKNLLTCTDQDILATEVTMTMVGGEVKWKRDSF